MKSIGSKHNQDDKENEAREIQFGDVATQQQTVDICHVGGHQRCQNAVELSLARGFGSKGWHELEEERQQWEEEEGVDGGAMSGTDEALLPDVPPH